MTKKITALLTLITLSTPVLAHDNIIVSYSTNTDTSNDSTKINTHALVKVTENIFKNDGALYVGAGKSSFKLKSIKSEATALIWRYKLKQGNNVPFSLSVGTDIIKSKWTVDANNENINATGTYIYADKKFKINTLYIKPNFEYKHVKYKTSSAFTELDEKTSSYGVTLYHNVNNFEIGVLLGSRKIENKIKTTTTIDGENNFSTRTNWFGIDRPYIKYKFDKNMEMTISLERYKYNTGDSSKTFNIGIGYRF